MNARVAPDIDFFKRHAHRRERRIRHFDGRAREGQDRTVMVGSDVVSSRQGTARPMAATITGSRPSEKFGTHSTTVTLATIVLQPCTAGQRRALT